MSLNSADEASAPHEFPVRYVYLGLVGFLVLIGLLIGLYTTVSVELNCRRMAEGSIECQLVRHSALLKMSPIIIRHPLAVDVVIHDPPDGERTYAAVVRLEKIGYTVPLYHSIHYGTIQNIADSVNQFLHESKAQEFSESFPGRFAESVK